MAFWTPMATLHLLDTTLKSEPNLNPERLRVCRTREYRNHGFPTDEGFNRPEEINLEPVVKKFQN